MSNSVISMSVEDYVAHSDLQVINEDTNLTDFQFELTTVEWHDGSPNSEQLVDVRWANSLVLDRSVRNKLIHTRWRSRRQHAQVLTHVCSNGKVYEFFWKAYTMQLWELLPPFGTAYTLVARFLLRQQRLQDEGETSSESGYEMASLSDDEEEEEDDDQGDDENNGADNGDSPDDTPPVPDPVDE